MKIRFTLLLSIFALPTFSQSDTLSITLENVHYPYPVNYLTITAEAQDLRMAYMDIQPNRPNGKAFLLFHGKNFAGYYWTTVIQALSAQGYRVIVPDQIGFGKSSKPYIHYSFHLLSRFNRTLLDTLKISHVSILGHSMGGMLATRFALMYPEKVEKLFLENPIGLEDYREFVPYISTEEQYRTELKSTAESVKKYYQTSYFPQWEERYEYLVRIGGGVAQSADFPRWAKVSAMTFSMIYEQPVVHEFKNLKVPTVLLIGKADKTIVGKALLSTSEQEKHGQYSILGKETAKKIPGARLIEFEGVGHIPHVQVPEVFNKALISGLR